METKTISPEQIAQLKQPLPKEAVKPHPTKNYLSSIKAIYVVERLNEVFGLGGWQVVNEVVRTEGKMVVVKSTFEAAEYGIVVRDIFGGNDNVDLGDAYKGACTDALTKIGSYLYIGMDVFKGLAEKPVTSYNHKTIEKDNKPLISNVQFKKLIERVEGGDKAAAEKAIQAFSFESTQLSLLYQKINAA